MPRELVKAVWAASRLIPGGAASQRGGRKGPTQWLQALWCRKMPSLGPAGAQGMEAATLPHVHPSLHVCCSSAVVCTGQVWGHGGRVSIPDPLELSAPPA